MTRREKDASRELGLSRPGRLRAARAWAARWAGKNIIKDYAHHFGVDGLCAAGDLKRLLRAGVKIDPAEADRVNRKVAHLERKRAQSREKRNRPPEPSPVESDETFAYIVGRTAWGFPYGVTWEELNEESTATPQDPRGKQDSKGEENKR